MEESFEDEDDFEDDDDDVLDDEPTVPIRVTTELRNDSPELVTTKNPDAKNSESSDIISVSDLESLFSESSDPRVETNTAHVGKVIVIEDVAFIT